MSFTFGFYNSLDGDRKYSAEQISEIFDGIIEDGVFASIEELFAVRTAENGMNVIVGPGRAWFDHTWNKNDSDLTLTLEHSDPLLSRYDAIVIEVDASVANRTNAIKVVKGENAVTPVKPTLIDEGTLHQHPLAYVLINPDVTEITASDIENAIGTAECPLVTGALETTDIDVLFRQWEGEFDDWFENVKEQLSDNVVTNLELQIERCVQKSDKATDADIKAGTVGKWVDAAGLSNSSAMAKKVMVEFLTSGTWTAPDNIVGNKIHVWCCGGGGGGGQSTDGGRGLPGGGGGGGYVTEGDFTVTPGTNYTIIIGAGGLCDISSGSTKSGDGGTTSFGSLLSADGGGGGYHATPSGSYYKGGNGGSGGSGGGGGLGYYESGSGGSGSGGGNGGSGGAGLNVVSGKNSYDNTDHAGIGGIGGSVGKHAGGGGGGYGGNGGAAVGSYQGVAGTVTIQNIGGSGGGGFFGNGGDWLGTVPTRGGGGAGDTYQNGASGVVRIEYYIKGASA